MEDYIKLVKACQPEFYESPSIDAEWNSSLKRTRRSVEISLKWLDQSLLIQKNLNVTLHFQAFFTNVISFVSTMEAYLELFKVEIMSFIALNVQLK